MLITGCSSGFGRELVRLYLQRGWIVVASMRSLSRRRDLLADELRLYPDRLHLLELDVTDGNQRRAAAQFAAEELGGRLDCLVNNAGYGLFGALEDLTEAQLRDQMEANFFGLAFLTRELLPSLRAAKGRIINISSGFGFSAFPLTGAYCASKFAVEGLSESLRYELAPHGVQVALVEPGSHRTEFARSALWGGHSFEPASAYFLQSVNYRRMKEKLSSGPMSSQAGPVVRGILRLSSMRRMPLRTRFGVDAKLGWMIRRILPEALYVWLFSHFFKRILLKRGRGA